MRGVPCLWLTWLVLVAPAAARLAEVTAEVGMEFVHVNGMTGRLDFPEMTGQGGALLDYDRDGDLDVFLIQGGPLRAGGEVVTGLPDRLLRNDPTPGSPGFRLVDVTAASGLEAAAGYGMGVAVGDYDGDGFADLYVTNYGPNRLWRNRGDGRFVDATADAGVGDTGWSTSAVFVDLDSDGDLDLYVANYVEHALDSQVECFAESSRRDYCGPAAYPPAADRLYLNRGDGTFGDVSSAAGLLQAPSAGLGVVDLDLDGSGVPAVLVANDGLPNQLWRLGADSRLVDEALLAGVAFNRSGEPEASMGIGVADFDEDGDEDLLLTHLDGETNTVYINLGDGLYEDRTASLGLAGPSLPDTSFGVAWLDVDRDGSLELAVASGAVRIQDSLATAGELYPLGQPNRLFRRAADGVFVTADDWIDPSFRAVEVSRGLVAGDVDGDGAEDLLLTNSNGPARLYRGAAEARRWTGVRVVELGSAASVKVEFVAGTAVRTVRLRTGGSYCSARDRSAVKAGGVDAVGVDVNGRRLRLTRSVDGRYLVFLANGSGR